MLPTRFNDAPKIKALLILFGQSGILFAISKWLPDNKIFIQYTICASFASSLTLILMTSFSAGVYGYTSECDPKKKFSRFIQLSHVAFFRGWPSVEEVKSTDIEDIHVVSKHSLAKFILETEKVKNRAIAVRSDPQEFSECFESLAGFMLYVFFQHDPDNHPDYCASFYTFNEMDKKFKLASSVSGNDKYAVSQTPHIGVGSLAYKAYTDGIIVKYDKNTNKVEDCNPPLKRNIKRFICLPVPAGENLDHRKRIGVLCVDSAKSGYHFDDPFHVNLLKYLALQVNFLYDVFFTQKHGE